MKLFLVLILLSCSLSAQTKDTLSTSVDGLIKSYETELQKNIECENWEEARTDIIFLDALYGNKLMQIAWEIQKASKGYTFTLEEMHRLIMGEKRPQELDANQNNHAIQK